jgi:hypothetical protein
MEMKSENSSMTRPPASYENGTKPHGRLILTGHLAAVALTLALAGCATKPPTVEVKIPVAVPCAGELPARPGSTFGAGKWPGDKAAAQAALIDAALWQGYAVKLEVVVAGCR